MNICIITEPLSANYGGILQNYALQTVLKRLNHSVFTFDVGKFSWFDWLTHSLAVTLHKIKGDDIHYLKTPLSRHRQEAPLRRFVNSNINLIHPRQHSLNISCLEKYKIEVFIVGSDQVWRPLYNHNIHNMFLSFTNNIDCKRLAYAASFGSEDWEYTIDQTNICKALAKRFDAISVRESSGVLLCKKHFNVDAQLVLDPTLLLNKHDYNHLCSHIPICPNFVFAYLLDNSPQTIREIEKFSRKHNLQFVIKKADANIVNDDSIEKWLAYFRDASYVITDSFHGTVFSIIFNKDFISLGNIYRGNARFLSLLDLLDLKQRLTNDITILDSSIINWGIVNEKIQNLREASYDWLITNLNK